MRKINLLFITQDLSNFVEQWTIELIKELDKLTNLILWYKASDIEDIINKTYFTPDFILLNDMRPEFCPEINGLNRLKIPFGILMCDAHFEEEKRKKFIIDNKVKYIFTFTKDEFLKRYSEFSNNMIWFPHFVDINIFKDYGQIKSINYLMMGLLWQEYYPLRQKIYEKMKYENGFLYIPHPGYGTIDTNTQMVGERYARKINKAKVFLTDGGKFNYAVKKYFEVPACNTLLMAPYTEELHDLGFIPDKNFVSINEKDFLQKARYYMEDERRRKQISLNGYNFVRSKHSSLIRAMELINNINNIINNST